jgi:hypothetical protein
VEYEYYRDLSRVTSSPLRKLYFKRESALLKKYERRLANKASFLSVSQNDLTTYRREFDCENISYLPLFLPPWKVDAISGMGGYCLYQGDLSVDANAKMAQWLVKKVFADIDISLKIAGKQPPASLQKMVRNYKNVTLVTDPAESEMQELIAKAHINIIPSFSGTGIKLKLLNALYNGRHCLVNNATVEGTGFEQLCHIANTTDHLKDLVAQLYYQPFREEEVLARKKMLEAHFDNAANAETLVRLVWD